MRPVRVWVPHRAGGGQNFENGMVGLVAERSTFHTVRPYLTIMPSNWKGKASGLAATAAPAARVSGAACGLSIPAPRLGCSLRGGGSGTTRVRVLMLTTYRDRLTAGA